MSTNMTWLEWVKTFSFDLYLRGDWHPKISLESLKAKTFGYYETNQESRKTYSFTKLRDALFGADNLNIVENVNQLLSDVSLALEVDFVSFDPEGENKISSTATTDKYVTTGGDTISSYKNPSFGYTFYSNKNKFAKSSSNSDSYNYTLSKINPSLDGDHSKYTVYITLKLLDSVVSENQQPSFTWKYYDTFDDCDQQKTSNLRSITTSQIDIFGNPVFPSVPQLTQRQGKTSTYKVYTCTGWTFVKDDTGRYYRAEYKGPETVSALFTVNDNNIFEDAENWLYGEKAPTKGLFLPLGDNVVQDDAQDILIQAPEDNAYSTIVSIPEFTIANSPLSYIKKGTFPKFKNKMWEVASNTWNSSTWNKTCRVKVIYTDEDDPNIASILTGAGDNDDALVTTFSGSGITRLGFVLVGAGGGAGGYNQYDGCSSGGTEEYTCPGSGGGGGEIVWGVLNLTAPPLVASNGGYTVLEHPLGTGGSVDKIRITSIEFKATLGAGGTQGSAGKNNSGTDGTSGGDSSLSLVINYKYFPPEGTEWLTGPAITIDTSIMAKGGNGGKLGTVDNVNEILGGSGGRSGHTTDKAIFANKWCVVCNAIEGNPGAGIKLNKEEYKKSYSDGASAKAYNLCFSTQTASITYLNSKSLKKQDAVVEMADKETIDSCHIPGGHSYGSGAYNTTVAEWGGGGCGGVASKSNGSGGNGFFGVYY